jgi:hypothetical protein
MSAAAHGERGDSRLAVRRDAFGPGHLLPVRYLHTHVITLGAIFIAPARRRIREWKLRNVPPGAVTALPEA